MGSLSEILKSIVEAGKGNIDYVAFATIAVLCTGALISNVGFGGAAGMAVILVALWVGMRWGLLEIQFREKLRTLQDHATMEAQKKLADHATNEETADLFLDQPKQGDGHER